MKRDFELLVASSMVTSLTTFLSKSQVEITSELTENIHLTKVKFLNVNDVQIFRLGEFINKNNILIEIPYKFNASDN